MKRALPEHAVAHTTPECYWDSLLVDDVRTLILTEHLDASSAWLFGLTSTQNLKYVQAHVPASVTISYGRGKNKKVGPLSVLAIVHHGHAVLVDPRALDACDCRCVYQYPLMAQFLPRLLVNMSYVYREQMCMRVAKLGHVDCLEKVMESFAPIGHPPSSEFGERLVCLAIGGDRPDNLRWLQKHFAIPLRDVHKTRALAAESLECLKYVHENGVHSWANVNNSSAPHLRNKDIFNFCVEHGLPASSVDMVYAACHGLRHQLEYCRARGVSWEARDIGDTLRLGTKLEHLLLAREFGCPWSATFLGRSVHRRSLLWFKYALENGCPVPLYEQDQENILRKLIDWREMMLVCQFVDALGRPQWALNHLRGYVRGQQEELSPLVLYISQ